MILDPINSRDKRVWDILNTLVLPVSFKPEVPLDDINKVLKSAHEMAVKTMLNDQETTNLLGNTFADSIKDSYFESTIQNKYGLITLKTIEGVSSRYILSNLLFYIEKNSVFDYVYTMITQEYTIPLIKKYREQTEKLTYMEVENKAIETIQEATKKLLYAMMVSYDFDSIREACQEITDTNLRDPEKSTTIINTLKFSELLSPDFVYDLALNPQNLSHNEDKIRKYIKDVELIHLPQSYFKFYKNVCKRSDAYRIKDEAERTKRERDAYHSIVGVRCDGLNSEEIEILNKIIMENIFIDKYKDIINNSIILRNIKDIIFDHKHINDIVTIDNDAVYFTSTDGKSKPRVFSYKNRIPNDDVDEEEEGKLKGVDDIDEEEQERLMNDDVTLSATGVGPDTFNQLYISNGFSRDLPKGPLERIHHRRRTINRLVNKFRSNYKVMTECSILEKGDYYEGFRYYKPNAANNGIFRTNNDEILLYALIELETNYKRKRAHIDKEKSLRRASMDLKGGRF